MLNNSLYEKTLSMVRDHDRHWIVRKRKINTETILKSLVASNVSNVGVSSSLNAHNFDIKHSSMNTARNKISPTLFKDINAEITKGFNDRVFAIDGSKVHVPHSFTKYGFKSRTNDKEVPRKAKRAMAMLSTLNGLESKTTVNYTITKHFNERKCVPQLIQHLPKDSVVIMDRGYFSKDLYRHFVESKIHCVFRLKMDGNKTIKKFYYSNKTELITTILVDEKLIPIRYVKYFINGNVYLIALSDMSISKRIIKQLYGMRWGVETSYKRLKSYNNLEKIYARTLQLWHQEVQLRILYDTMIVREQDKHDTKRRKTTRRKSYQQIKLVVFFHIIKQQSNVVVDFSHM